jgi:SP family general alpha glucoside:H+ symporter-like MFS transporter
MATDLEITEEFKPSIVQKDISEVDKETFKAHLLDAQAHDETIAQSLRSHPWALLWVAYGVWIVACCSFDNNAGGTVLGIPKFREDFGYYFEGDYILVAAWQVGP